MSEKMGWVRFFLVTSVVALPSILLFIWIGPRDDFRNGKLKPTLNGAEDISEDHIAARKL